MNEGSLSKLARRVGAAPSAKHKEVAQSMEQKSQIKKFMVHSFCLQLLGLTEEERITFFSNKIDQVLDKLPKAVPPKTALQRFVESVKTTGRLSELADIVDCPSDAPICEFVRVLEQDFAPIKELMKSSYCPQLRGLTGEERAHFSQK
eukprot:gb/GECG01005617.1/.p1 GENE.gb/GECG01005617.1/~~gb/GECG01005617.1/.p1  ORF type:complete len:148 (+),score=20.60 gb/GECG01005617.1/:1-444(+)